MNNGRKNDNMIQGNSKMTGKYKGRKDMRQGK